jgi:hypothetical protein
MSDEQIPHVQLFVRVICTCFTGSSDVLILIFFQSDQ